MENMQLVGKVARDVLDGNYSLTPDLTLKARKEKARTAGLIITHTGYILDYVNADRGQVLYKGHLCCEGRPRDILDHIRQHGYQECVRCMN
jgi:Fe-S cluster assembly ATP-binding protein